MKVFIAKQFDKREVGTCIDLPESTANILLDKGIVVYEKEAEVNNIKKSKKNEKVN